MRRDFSFSSLVAMSLGLSWGFSSISASGPPTSIYSQECSRAQEPSLVGMGYVGFQWLQARESWQESSLLPRRGRCQCVGREAAVAALLSVHHSTLAPWKESHDQPRQHTKKQRHYFADKHQHIVKAVVFPLLMYGCESWTIKKTEDQRIDAFELQC